MPETNKAPSAPNHLSLTVSIVSAYVRNNSVAVDGLPGMIGNVHRMISVLGGTGESPGHADKPPAVSVKQSITPDYLVCLEDGKRLKMLKRYIRSRFKLTPDEYRKKWGLPHDYPMVAANYAKRRSDLAKQSGLGRNPSATAKRKAKK